MIESWEDSNHRRHARRTCGERPGLRCSSIVAVVQKIRKLQQSDIRSDHADEWSPSVVTKLRRSQDIHTRRTRDRREPPAPAVWGLSRPREREGISGGYRPGAGRPWDACASVKRRRRRTGIEAAYSSPSRLKRFGGFAAPFRRKAALNGVRHWQYTAIANTCSSADHPLTERYSRAICSAGPRDSVNSLVPDLTDNVRMGSRFAHPSHGRRHGTEVSCVSCCTCLSLEISWP